MRLFSPALAGLFILLVTRVHAADSAAPAAATSPVTAAAPALPPVVFPKPPRLATTEAELAEDRKAADFATRKDTAVKAADTYLATQVPLPDDYASWIFYYACPDDGSTLE